MLKLITLLAGGIPAIIAGIVGFIARKAGTAVASIATYAVLLVAFIACNRAIFGTVMTMFSPPAWVSNVLGMFFPSNFILCVSSIMSAYICRVAFDIARFKLKLLNDAS